MALLRDVPFIEFDNNPLAKQAAAELTKLPEYRGPRLNGVVTPGLLFRGDARGDARGPYLSQFLFRDIPYGVLLVPQLTDTVKPGERPVEDPRHLFLELIEEVPIFLFRADSVTKENDDQATLHCA